MVFGLGKKKKKKDKTEGEEQEEGKTEEKEEKKPEEEAKEGKGGEEKPEGEGEGAAPKKSKKKIIILGVLALVVLIGGAAGAYFAGVFGGSAGEGHDGEAKKDVTKAVYYTMPEFLVNLNSTTKSASFLKTTIILELGSATDIIIVEANLPRLMDAFNTYLRELRSSDLAGSAGIQRLREELLLRCNKALAPTEINDVLFKEIVVQ